VLIDEVRRARSLKRTPDPVQTLWRSAQGEPIALDIEAVNGAVEELAKASPEHARFVELRFFVGLTLEETAEACGVSLATAKRRWQAARAWLFEALRAP
jgi:DNA-directed RNA polymerase specialized sigma24 family protein